MKKLVCIAVLVLGATVLAQSSQSVDQAARNQRAQDQSAGQQKVYTNDDFPDKTAPAPAQDENAPSDAAKPDDKAAAQAEKAEEDDAAKQAKGYALEHQVDSPRDENGNPIKEDKKPAESASTDKAGEKSAAADDSAEKKTAEDTTDVSAKTSKKSMELKESDKEDKEKDAKSSEDSQASLDAEWKGKIDAQKSKIAGLQREYDLTDREYKLFATSYYADAGNRLRDQKDFHDQEISFRDKLGNLKQQIADEQSKLGELQDQAHKAGANKAYD